MSSILQEIRRLESARDRGELSAEEFAAAKETLLGSVEDATVISQERPRRRAQPSPAPVSRNAPSGFWGIVAIALVAALAMTVLVGQMIGDFTIALTLVISVLAAVLVAAFRRLEG